MSAQLWHYTCEHGREGIGNYGYVVAVREHDPDAFETLIRRGYGIMGLLSWFTDLETPMREVLGLTSESITCDRTKYRYRVTDPTNCEPWVGSPMRRAYSARLVNNLEVAGMALPMHWYVAVDPVPVVFDPIEVPV